MPIQPINYLNSQSVTSPFKDLDFAKLLQQGMQLRHEPQRLIRQKEQEELANALGREKLTQAQMTTPYVPRQLEAKITKDELLAQTGGTFPSGDTGELIHIQKMIDRGDPNGQLALKNWMSKYNQREQMIESGPLRWASQTGKHSIERVAAEKALENKGMSPKERRQAETNLRALQLKEFYESAPPAAQEKFRAGEQIHKTLNSIDFNVLSKAAGPSGLKWLGQQSLLALRHKESPEYRKYLTSIKGLEGLSESVGTFYGTPAAIQAQDRLRKFIHDPRWVTNPRIMKEELNYIKNLLNSEHETFTDFMLYRPEDIQKISNPSQGSAQVPPADLGQKNATLLKKQKAMAEALKKTQPGGNEPNKNKSNKPVKTYRYVNGEVV